jgi:hypothetical protein
MEDITDQCNLDEPGRFDTLLYPGRNHESSAFAAWVMGTSSNGTSRTSKVKSFLRLYLRDNPFLECDATIKVSLRASRPISDIYPLLSAIHVWVYPENI